MRTAEEYLIDFNPSFKNISIKDVHTFSGEFLLFIMEKFAKERSIEFGRWKQPSRYELMPSDYSEFMKSITNKQWQ